MFRYVHTNIIAKDVAKLIDFYKTVLHCKSIDQTRDLRGEWLDKLTGLKQAHISGEHLLLPGYENDHPTLEIFSYDTLKESIGSEINRLGYAHIAFEVDDVAATLAEILNAGGSCVGDMVTAAYPNGMEAVIVYARDPEGNIVELQSWRPIRTGGGEGIGLNSI
ncbi:MAG: VOC family protein [Dehalococcoidales bacterium]|nr:VOC family protein [Dehalococcoidales bacterium]